MSELSHRLETERPSRKLCREASDRIGELEDALMELEAHFLVAHRKLDVPMHFHVQKALYGEEAAQRLNPGLAGTQ